MTQRWLISAPVWGQRCVDVFCSTALPALERAVGVLEADERFRPYADVRVVVHTDQPGRIAAAATGLRIEARAVPAGLRDFDCLSQAHREVLAMACSGDAVVLLTADMVVSEHALLHCAAILSGDDSKRLIACAGMRAVECGPLPSTAAGELMMWAWEHRHPLTRDCTWPFGQSRDLSRVYFADEVRGTISAQLALPHPLVVRVDGRRLPFTPTIDANLMQNFAPAEIHLVATSEELAVVELSPVDKQGALAETTIGQRVRAREFIIHDPLQRWLFDQRVCLVSWGPRQRVGPGVLVLADDGVVRERED